MKTYKAELIKNGKVVKVFEEKTSIDWSTWRFTKALSELKPKGEEIKWYIDNKIKLS